jgi:hypothetical protein
MAVVLHPRVKELGIEVWGREFAAQQIWRSIEFRPRQLRRLPAAGCRMPAAGCRLSAAG